MTVSLVFAGQRVEVAESTLELAAMALADYGEARARGVLRELIPALTLLEACAAVAEAVRRRTISPEDLTMDDICAERTASQKDLESARAREDRQRAREGEAYCLSALAPDGQPVVSVRWHARQQVADRINRRRGIKP